MNASAAPPPLDDHAEAALKRLRRVEGQVRGVAAMVETGRYCIDIVNQIEAARAALLRVEQDLLRRHLDHCIAHAIDSGDPHMQRKKVEELIALWERAAK
ncbi:MAG: metal-sensitive transcriptional regulator [Hyphomonadaceae bacterium]|nr:metal-sensitive transcriptional regulator [Hyphomonadaceae bacterium]